MHQCTACGTALMPGVLGSDARTSPITIAIKHTAISAPAACAEASSFQRAIAASDDHHENRPTGFHFASVATHCHRADEMLLAIVDLNVSCAILTVLLHQMTSSLAQLSLHTARRVYAICNVYLRQEGYVFIGTSYLVSLFVSRITRKKTSKPIFKKFDGKVAHGQERNY